MTYRIVAVPMTLSDLQGHAHNVGLLRCDFSYNRAAVGNISTDIARRAVPLRQLSFLSKFLHLQRRSSKFAVTQRSHHRHKRVAISVPCVKY